jgi:hypothetical protein
LIGIRESLPARRTLTPLLATFSGVLAGACSFDRDRPSPVEAADTAALSVELLEPSNGITVVAGRDLVVRVSARDLSGNRLEGVGFVARRFASGNNATLDSAVFALAGEDEATHEFAFSVPSSLPTSTQLDIFGIALGPGSQARLSIPRSVIVAQCQPGQPGC